MTTHATAIRIEAEKRRARVREMRASGMTLAAIATELGISQSRAGQIAARARRCPPAPPGPIDLSADLKIEALPLSGHARYALLDSEYRTAGELLAADREELWRQVLISPGYSRKAWKEIEAMLNWAVLKKA
jgi:hypothetical protein